MCPYRQVIYYFEACPENGWQPRVPTLGKIEWTEYGWLMREENYLGKTKQIWVGSSKLPKILIGDENKDKLMKYATMEVSIFL